MKRSRRFFLVALSLAAGWADLRAGGPEAPKPIYTGYDEQADAAQDIAAALAAARPQDQRVLVIFGANWCGPCRKLHALLYGDKTLGALLRERYRVVSVDVNGSHNSGVKARYGYQTGFGLPALAVLAADGSLLKLQDTREFAEGNHQDRAKVLAFLQAWASAPR